MSNPGLLNSDAVRFKSPLEAWVRSRPEVAAVAYLAPDWIIARLKDGREATIGCCWPDAPCEKHDQVAKFKAGFLEFVNASAKPMASLPVPGEVQ